MMNKKEIPIQMIRDNYCASAILLICSIIACPSIALARNQADDSPSGVSSWVTQFEGVIDKSAQKSVPYWPSGPTPPEDAPNILIWMIDDAGFGQLQSYGGLIETPVLNDLARGGVSYTNFHTTALCSPTRAALLSGRNHHAIGMGAHAGTSSGFPGYLGRVAPSAATIAKVLQQNGYATFALGKWDHLPQEDTSSFGPFTYWPSGQGFDHFYGFLAAETDNFHPPLWSDHTPVDPWKDNPDYHLTTDLADRAIEWIRGLKSSAPGKPFFMYWATGAVHSPHHAPRAYIDKYAGRFDMGWDQAREEILQRQKVLGVVPKGANLPPRPASIKAWEALDATGKKVAARAMEAFAAQLDHADYEFGRIIETLKRTDQFDNTIIIVLSDNGASAEGGLEGTYNEYRSINRVPTTYADNEKYLDSWGGPGTHAHYPVGWAMAGNTPLKYYKQSAHEGGVRGPLIVSWPKGIRDRGGLRPQFHHVTDIMATLLDVTEISLPTKVDGVAQQPLDGVSMRYSFDDASAPTPKTKQYFELWGNRGIWSDGWKAVLLHNAEPWNLLNYANLRIDDSNWELYQTSTDFNELVNLADSNPAKLEEMKRLFDEEARRNNVYPLAPDSMAERKARFESMIGESGGRFEFEGAVRRIPESNAPPVQGCSFTIEAQVQPQSSHDTGVIVAAGGDMGGYTLFLREGVPMFCYNSYGEFTDCIRGNRELPPDTMTTLRFAFDLDKGKTGQEALIAGGKGRLYIGDQEIGSGVIRRTNRLIFSVSEFFSIGRDDGSAVSSYYEPATVFPGGIGTIVYQINFN